MFRRFFSGRYGNDHLGFALVVFMFILGIVSIFTEGWAGAVIWVLQTAVLVIVLLRMMSRNFSARRRENEKFLAVWSRVKNWFSRFFKRFTDRSHKYFKCPRCSATLRVPRGHGSITVTCPRCAHKFDKRS